jgi:hypothetical protein
VTRLLYAAHFFLVFRSGPCGTNQLELKSEFGPSPTNSDHNWGHCQSLHCFVSRICTSLTLGRKSLLKWGFWTTPLANLGKNSFAFHISLSSFCRWTGTNLEGDLVWAVPTLSSIFVCIVLKDNTSSVIKLSKTGSFINRTEIGLQLLDAGIKVFKMKYKIWICQPLWYGLYLVVLK